MRAAVGKIAHYVSWGTPIQPDGTQAYESTCRAAIVTTVQGPAVVGLAVLNPSGMFFHEAVAFDDGLDPGDGNGVGASMRPPAPGTWHWPCITEER